jgi:hypothetical protein
MRITTQYNRVDRVIYEFSESDLENAMLAYAKVKPYEQGKSHVYEFDQNEIGEIKATLTVVWETPVEEGESDES